MTDLLAAQWGADRLAATVDFQVLMYQPNSIDVLEAPVKSLKFNDPSAILGGLTGALLLGKPGAVAGYVGVFGLEVRNALAVSIPEYLDSERDGASELWTLFYDMRGTCKTTKFVLAGYSQGAMVVHDFLNRLARTHDTASQASIIGVALLGDPYRVRFAGVHEFGTAPSAGYGLCNLPRLLGLPQCSATPGPQDIAPMFQARTVSVCMYDDPVCDSSDFVPDLANHWYFHSGPIPYFSASSAQSFINLGLAIHSSYSYVSDAALAGELMGQFVLTHV